MEKRELGNSKLFVSRLGFGCLCMGYLQQNLSVQKGGELIMYAVDNGINFFDTAQFYKTYEHIAYAVKNGYNDLIICTKSYAYSKQQAEQAFNEAIRMSGKEIIDIFLLHETESIDTIKGHYEALEFYIKMKEKGYIKAVGVSTHCISAVKSSALINDIDVIEAIININGIGIVDGTAEEMCHALEFAAEMGKGVIAMKPLGGGNLFRNPAKCFEYLIKNVAIDSILCGMVSKEEIEANVSFFNGDRQSDILFENLTKVEKCLLIENWCTGCGDCVKKCSNGALSIKDSVAICDEKKCLTCGYCSAACKEMALKLISIKN